MSLSQTIAILIDADDSIACNRAPTWAVDHLKHSLERCGFIVRDSAADPVRVFVKSVQSNLRTPFAVASPQRQPESFVMDRRGNDIVVIGADERGLVYALTELADRIAQGHDDPFAGPYPLVGRPQTKIRSIMRIFASEREDKSWFYDKSHWIEYLTMLATNRFNRFSLTLGIQYDYPYHNELISDVYFHFPYPYLLDLPQHPVRILELSAQERQANLDMLKFIGKEAGRRGLDFQLGLWTQRYDFDDAPNAAYTVMGATDDNIGPYCRDAIAALLHEVPEITGLTFRIHVEGGISEGNYDFWRTAFDGIKSAGRPVEIDMHAKGLDETTLNVALETGMPVTASPKFLAEHIGLSYHPSAIREREYPPTEAMTNREKLSVGSRRFLRQSYGDLLPKNKKWNVLFRVWPGTQRVLAWGDPELAAGYGRSAGFAGADGIEWMEPLSMKGRQGSGIVGGRALYTDYRLAERLDWKKFLYQYRLWGRMSYDPNADKVFEASYLARHCGSATPAIEQALSAASKILPLVTQVHGPSIANNAYWPEIYTNMPLLGDGMERPYGFDMDGPPRFGNAPTFDPELFCNPREFISALLDETTNERYSPLDVAMWLSTAAQTAEAAAHSAQSSIDSQKPFAQRLLIDAQALAGIGRFFAEKLRGACWAELFLATGLREARLRACDHLRLARAAWKTVADLTAHVYQSDLAFGPGPHLRGDWAARLPDIDRELLELSAHRQPQAPMDEGERAKVAPVVTAMEGWRATQLGTDFALDAPQTFRAGKAIAIAVSVQNGAVARLHYRPVNQAERWRSVAMQVSDGRAKAEIPANESATEFHLQFFITIRTNQDLSIVPGFSTSLSNQPYGLIIQT